MKGMFEIDAMDVELEELIKLARVENLGELGRKLVLREIVQRRIEKDTSEYRERRARELAQEHGLDVR